MVKTYWAQVHHPSHCHTLLSQSETEACVLQKFHAHTNSTMLSSFANAAWWWLLDRNNSKLQATNW